jgi:hypothetical protein
MHLNYLPVRFTSDVFQRRHPSVRGKSQGSLVDGTMNALACVNQSFMAETNSFNLVNPLLFVTAERRRDSSLWRPMPATPRYAAPRRLRATRISRRWTERTNRPACSLGREPKSSSHALGLFFDEMVNTFDPDKQTHSGVPARSRITEYESPGYNV